MQIPQTKQELELLFTFEPNGSDSSDLPEIQVVSEKMKEIHFLLFGNPNISSEILMEYVQSATMILSAYHSTVSTFIRNVFQLNCDDWILEVNVTALLCLPDSDAFNSPIQYYIHEQKIISILVHLSQKIPNSRSMIKNYILELSKKDGISIHRLRDALTSKMMFLELCLQWTCNDILDLVKTTNKNNTSHII
ncbi:hypothetical protein BC833DRAFT_320907 [Globomyces pollinis-pini]|nr:hypothetical protein BC833DRAFT_320907 [Globomyces pollinis-pini]